MCLSLPVGERLLRAQMPIPAMAWAVLDTILLLHACTTTSRPHPTTIILLMWLGKDYKEELTTSNNIKHTVNPKDVLIDCYDLQEVTIVARGVAFHLV